MSVQTTSLFIDPLYAAKKTLANALSERTGIERSATWKTTLSDDQTTHAFIHTLREVLDHEIRHAVKTDASQRYARR